MTTPGPLATGAIQEIQHVMKEYMEKMDAMFNSVATLVTKITQ
jgi:hypothetical protein